uniref:Uncharacterized protein n=1 Tax=Cacopsylla melanoneura TaxID=428564 RepID=A0A8D8PNS0_9HEMI
MKNKNRDKNPKGKEDTEDQDSEDIDGDVTHYTDGDVTPNTDDNVTACTPKNIAVNGYVIINYEEEFYPGILLEKVAGDSWRIKTMDMAGPGTWNWPSKDDILVYNDREIVCNIKPPEIINSRGIYLVPEIDIVRKTNVRQTE